MTTPQGVRDAPCGVCFLFWGKFVFGGRAFACTAGFFPRFGITALKARRGEGHPLYWQTSSLMIDTSVGDAAPPSNLLVHHNFSTCNRARFRRDQVTRPTECLCSITHYKCSVGNGLTVPEPYGRCHNRIFIASLGYNIPQKYIQGDDASASDLLFLRVMAAGVLTPPIAAKIPQQVPQNQSNPVMNKFCFQLGLTRHSTARPIPAPEHSPAKKTAKGNSPPIYS